MGELRRPARLWVLATALLVAACGPTLEAADPPADSYTIDTTKIHDGPNQTALTSLVTSTPYTGRESFARYVIVTDAPSIQIFALTDLGSSAGGYNSAGLLVNGTPQGSGVPLGAQGSIGSLSFGLPAGTNTLQLIDGPASVAVFGGSPVRYTPVLTYKLPAGSSHSVTAPTAPAARIVVLADSLSQGAFTSSPPNQASVYQAWPILMRANALASGSGAFAGAHVIVNGSGGRQWLEEAGDASKITASIARLTAELDGTGANLVVAALGTNDWGLGASAANIQAQVGAWLDQFHATFAAVNVILVTPTTRSGETTPNAGGATLPDIRTAIANAQASRSSYAYLVNGPTLVTYPTNFASDNLHLKTAGMVEYESNLRAAMVAASLGY